MEKFFEWMNRAYIQKLLGIFDENIRFVGGCVRDSLMGIEVGDIDAATNLLPEEVILLLNKNNIRHIPTGIEHGTITAIIDNIPIEITSLRKDIECFGRQAIVEFTDDWAVDAQRRDFTINALYVDKTGKIFDYVGGLADIEKKQIRFIGNANLRIKEDYLRIFRFFRFLATHGNDVVLEADLQACADNAKYINEISKERIHKEMLKLFAAKNPLYALHKMALCKVLIKDIPLSFLNLLEIENNFSPNNLLRISLLLRSDNLDRSKFVFSNHDKKIISMLEKTPVIIPAKSAIRKFGKENYILLLLRYWAENYAAKNINWLEHINFAKDWEIPIFPISGNDLIKLGLSEGKKLGEKLQEMENYWEDNDYIPNKKELLERFYHY